MAKGNIFRKVVKGLGRYHQIAGVVAQIIPGVGTAIGAGIALAGTGLVGVVNLYETAKAGEEKEDIAEKKEKAEKLEAERLKIAAKSEGQIAEKYQEEKALDSIVKKENTKKGIIAIALLIVAIVIISKLTKHKK